MVLKNSPSKSLPRAQSDALTKLPVIKFSREKRRKNKFTLIFSLCYCFPFNFNFAQQTASEFPQMPDLYYTEEVYSIKITLHYYHIFKSL